MKHRINFTPGPSQLYFTVENHIKAALREDILSLSHRSKKFEAIYQETSTGLRELLAIPENFNIYFTASATEIWERTIQNLVIEKSFHFVNGSFSKRFSEIAEQLNKKPVKLEAEFGKGFEMPVEIGADAEVIAVTHNETSTGLSLPPEFIYSLRDHHPDGLIVVDAVSSLPYPHFDLTKIDSVFFSVQKGFGLPAGLGVWIANERCVAKAERVLASGQSIGSYHSLPSLHTHALRFQTPETPNVLAIYLLNKVVHDMLRRGINAIRKETEYKAAILYQLLNSHPLMKPFVTEARWQSKTVIVADCSAHTPAISEQLFKKGMVPGDGYGSFKKTQLRFANFPTHSKEQYELLVDTLSALDI